MALQFFVIFALAAIANAGLVPEAATVVKTVEAVEDFDANPQYRFNYGVHDAVSGDSKSQVEQRDGDLVKGEYSLVDADGFKRTVKYTSDPVNGFQADVQREPLVQTVVKTVEPVAQYSAPVATYAAPTYVRSVAPVTHFTAPVATTYSTAYTAPIAHYSAVPAVSYYSNPTTFVTHH